MKKKPYYLKKYKDWMKAGRMDSVGLCRAFNYSKAIGQFSPSYEETEEYNCSGVYWGSNDRLWRKNEFTPLRQTIVLFLAAMNDEL